MSFDNPDWYGLDGSTRLGRPPVSVHVKGPAGYKLSSRQQGETAQVFQQFGMAVRNSSIPDGFHSRRVRLGDGSHVEMVANAGVYQVVVRPKVGSGPDPTELYSMRPTCLFASYSARFGQQPELPDATPPRTAAVAPTFDSTWACSVWTNPPIRVGASPPYEFKFAHGEKMLWAATSPEDLSNSMPGNTDWSDRRPADQATNYGLVLSWWAPRTGRYCVHDPFIAWTLGPVGIANAASKVDQMMAKAVWCNGVPLLFMGNDEVVHSACLWAGVKDIDGAPTFVRELVVLASNGVSISGEGFEFIKCYRMAVPRHIKAFGPGSFFVNQQLPPPVWTLTEIEGRPLTQALTQAPIYCNSSGTAALIAYTTPMAQDSTTDYLIQTRKLKLAELNLVDGSLSVAAEIENKVTVLYLSNFSSYDPLNGTNHRKSNRVEETLLALDYNVDAPAYVVLKRAEQEEWIHTVVNTPGPYSSLTASEDELLTRAIAYDLSLSGTKIWEFTPPVHHKNQHIRTLKTDDNQSYAEDSSAWGTHEPEHRLMGGAVFGDARVGSFDFFMLSYYARSLEGQSAFHTASHRNQFGHWVYDSYNFSSSAAFSDLVIEERHAQVINGVVQKESTGEAQRLPGFSYVRSSTTGSGDDPAAYLWNRGTYIEKNPKSDPSVVHRLERKSASYGSGGTSSFNGQWLFRSCVKLTSPLTASAMDSSSHTHISEIISLADGGQTKFDLSPYAAQAVPGALAGATGLLFLGPVLDPKGNLPNKPKRT